MSKLLYMPALEGINILVNPKLKDADSLQIKYFANDDGSRSIPLDCKFTPFVSYLTEDGVTDEKASHLRATLHINKENAVSHLKIQNRLTGERYTLFISCGNPDSDTASSNKGKLLKKKTGKVTASNDVAKDDFADE